MTPSPPQPTDGSTSDPSDPSSRSQPPRSSDVAESSEPPGPYDVPEPSEPAGARPLVVIPTYNERDTLPVLVDLLLTGPTTVDILVVDDNSPDGTGEWADQRARESEQVQVLHRPGKQGLGAAYRAGLGWGLDHGYQLLVEMDADLSHDPAHLPELLAAAEHADLVIGSRYVPGGGTSNWPWHRRALSSGGNTYVRLWTGLPLRDATAGFRVFRAPVLDAIGLTSLNSDGYSFQVETALAAHRAGFRIVEVPIMFAERTVGASKMSRRIVVEAMARVVSWGLEGPRTPQGVHPASIAAPSAPPASPPASHGSAPAAQGR